MEKVATVKESNSSIVGRRILFFVNDFESLKLHRKSLIQYLVAVGAELHIATPRPKENYPSSPIGGGSFLPSEVKLHWLSLSRKGKNPFQDVSTLTSFRRIVKELKPDLIHNFTIKPVIYGSLAAKSAGAPAVVNTITGLGHVFVDDTKLGAIIRKLVCALYRQAFSGKQVQVIFQNPDDREVFEKAGILKGKESVLVPGSGVDPNVFVPALPSTHSGDQSKHDSKPCRIVFAGRLLWTKGVGELAEAMAILNEASVPCELHLYGSIDLGNPAAIKEQQVREWENRGLLKWHGASTNMVGTIQGADIICLPSYREGISRFLLEAGACAKAIVTTDAPGGRDIIRHEVNGLLAQIKDAHSLAEALKRLTEDPLLREQLGKKAREIVLEKFTEQRVNGMVVRTYLNAIGNIK